MVMLRFAMVSWSPPFCSKFRICSCSSRIYLSASPKFYPYSLICKFNLSISCVKSTIRFSNSELSGFSLNLSTRISNYSIFTSKVLIYSSDFLKLSLLSLNFSYHSALRVRSISILRVLSISILRVLSSSALRVRSISILRVLSSSSRRLLSISPLSVLSISILNVLSISILKVLSSSILIYFLSLS